MSVHTLALCLAEQTGRGLRKRDIQFSPEDQARLAREMERSLREIYR